MAIRGAPTARAAGERGDALGLLAALDGHAGRIRPQVFEPVERAGARVMQMDDHLAAIQQHPLEILRRVGLSHRCGGAFGMPHRLSLAGEDRFDVVADRGDLRRGLRRAHDEEIGHVRERAQIKDDDLFRVLLERCARREQRFSLAVNKLGRTHELIIR